MQVFNLFQFFYNKRCRHEDLLFKGCVHWERLILRPYFVFYLCYPILLDYFLDDIICLINTDWMLTLDHVNIEELYFWYFLEGIIKENTKLLH